MNVDLLLRVFSILFGPIAAVIITLGYTRYKEKREAKLKLFLTLMAHRKRAPTQELVDALNVIDVVYAEHQNVSKLWHDYYAVQSQPTVNQEQAGHTYLLLLSAMAQTLGYKRLQQVDMDKFYLPTGLVQQANFQTEIQTELLRVLKNSAKFEAIVQENALLPSSSQTETLRP